MSRRRRPHPARRARRVAGTAAAGAYAGLVVAVGISQQSSEAQTSTASTVDEAATQPISEAAQRLDLGAAATFAPTPPPTDDLATLDGPTTIPAPLPPPSVAVTTTIVPRPTAAPRTSPTVAPPSTNQVAPTTAPPSAAPTTTTVFIPPPPPPNPPTTVVPTTTAPVTPTTPPPTTIPTGGS